MSTEFIPFIFFQKLAILKNRKNPMGIFSHIAKWEKIPMGKISHGKI